MGQMANNIKIENHIRIQVDRRIKVITKNGDRGFTGNIYTLLQDYEEMSLLIDFMNEGETFIDEANIGTYSLLAGKLCNAK